jgi:flagellar biosynthesis anti-sigma factor FlgM
MRIGPNVTDLRSVSTDRAENSSATSAKTRVESFEPSESFAEDTVSISSLAAKAMQTPPIRQDKVESLRQSVASGQYELDPDAIASAMVGQA